MTYKDLRQFLMEKEAKKDMPPFLEQDRSSKAKEVYRALKRDHPNMDARKKARIANAMAKKADSGMTLNLQDNPRSFGITAKQTGVDQRGLAYSAGVPEMIGLTAGGGLATRALTEGVLGSGPLPLVLSKKAREKSLQSLGRDFSLLQSEMEKLRGAESYVPSSELSELVRRRGKSGLKGALKGAVFGAALGGTGKLLSNIANYEGAKLLTAREGRSNLDTLRGAYEGARSRLPLQKEGEVKYRGRTFPGYNQPIASDRPQKKKMVLAKKGDQVRLIHFGQKGYRHNYSKAAKKSYLARSAGIRGKGGSLTAKDKFSANYWARRELWPRGKADGSTASSKKKKR